MTRYKSTDRLIPVPSAKWAKVAHGDCVQLNGEVLIADLITLRAEAVINFGLPEQRVWELWQDDTGTWHAYAFVPGTGLPWWSERVTYRGEVLEAKGVVQHVRQ